MQQLAAADGLTALVASEIRAMMGRLNVNRAELARRLGVEDSWVGKRLNGRTEISLTDFQKIADALGVGIVDLLPRDRRQTVTGGYPPAPAVIATPERTGTAEVAPRLGIATYPIARPDHAPPAQRIPPGRNRTAPTGVAA